MKELEILAEELQEYFSKKEAELRTNPNFNSYTEGSLFNRRREVDHFRHESRNIQANPLQRDAIIENFKRELVAIKSAIDKMSS